MNYILVHMSYRFLFPGGKKLIANLILGKSKIIIYLKNSKTNHIFIKQTERSQKKGRIYYK